MIEVLVLETSLTEDHMQVEVIFGELYGTRTWTKTYRRGDLPDMNVESLYSFFYSFCFLLIEHEGGDFDVLF